MSIMNLQRQIDYQNEAIRRGQDRMQRLCNGGRMRPETMYYELAAMRAILRTLEEARDQLTPSGAH